MRWGLLVLLAACGARVGDNGIDPPGDATANDVANVVDSGVDAPPDARPCDGGNGAMPSDDGTCIVLFTTPESFADADAACIAFGSRLAILSTPERDAAAAALIGTADVFIGLTDVDDEGTFSWVDGTPVTFTNFDDGEPNNANGAFQEDCAMYSGTRGGWDDRPCSNQVAGIGQVPGEYPYLCLF